VSDDVCVVAEIP